VGPAPLPPHERTWRHPSELAADERDLVRLSEASSSTRAFAMVTGTVGLLAVAALMITITPRREHSPVALESTTIPSAQVASLAVVSSVATTPPRSLALAVAIRLATPVGDGRQALMTLSGADAAEGTELDVQLTSGPVVTAVVAGMTDEMMVVSISGQVEGHTIASGLPSPDEIVTVMLDPPITVPFADVGEVDAGEGTPVLDDDGELVGLCTRGHGAGGATSVVDVTGSDDGVVDSTVSASTVVGSSVPDSSVTDSSVTDSRVTASSAPATSAVATSAAP
jgi:hypothetical protein